jgi:methionyl-tRNA formyltransferase
VTVAAEIVLHRSLPSLVDGTAALKPQDLSKGGYFGGRKPEDGRIDWSRPAREIHDLVRAVAPPYPGAHTPLGAGLPSVGLSAALVAQQIDGA